MQRIISSLVALSCSLMLACPAGVPENRPECSDIEDIPCPSGFVCVDFECRAVCKSSLDCQPADACIDEVCTPYAQSCSSSADCLAEFYCAGSTCRKREGLGAPCGTQAEACQSDLCVDGVCCDSICDGLCESCIVGTGVGDGDDGNCTNIPVGLDPNGDAACDGAGLCFDKQQGDACELDYECASGACPDVVCCNDRCSGVCQECPIGYCTPIANGLDHDNECEAFATCDGANACWAQGLGDPCGGHHECISGYCNPSSICAFQCTSSADCGGNDCLGGRCCTGACSGACMSCNENETGQSDGACAPILVGSDPNDAHCPGVPACNGSGACFAKANGTHCDEDYECSSGWCVDGVCCNAACTGRCQACDGVDTDPPSAVGQCSFVANWRDPAGECTGPQACDGAGGCWAKVGGDPCNNDAECVCGVCCGGHCTFGWTQMTSPVTVNLTGVWGSAADDVWAVGLDGVILHFNGSQWTDEPSPTSEHLTGISGSAWNNIIAVGTNGVAVRYNGSSWTLHAAASVDLNDIWVRGTSEAYAVGDSGTIRRWSGGTSWATEGAGLATGEIRAVDGSGTTVYAVGGGSLFTGCTTGTSVLRRTGGTWAVVPGFPSGSCPTSVVAYSEPEAIIGTLSDLILPPSCDSHGWRAGLESGSFDLVNGTGVSDLAVGASTVFQAGVCSTGSSADGVAWQAEASVPSYLSGVWAADDCEAFAVGENGELFRR